jgi:SAM-dependent methyltransferase
MIATDEEIWTDFCAWLPTAPTVSNPVELFRHYQERQAAGGASAAEIAERLTAVQAMMRARTDGWRLIFDNIYRHRTPGFTTRPTELLASAIRERTPGRALDIGMGQGRNAVFLATQGWTVTGFDLSDAGLAIARESAARAGVTIDAVRASEREFDYGEARWDLVVFTYEPFPITSDAYVARLQRAMRPAARIVIESFSEPEGKPNRTATAIDPDRLLAAFRAFRIVRFEDDVGEPDWTHWDRQPRVVRLIAEKR